jgi:YhcN/YlaJ family sporulation lipoprotein
LITKKNHKKKIAMLLVIVAIMATGCTNNANNQIKQQGVRMQQAINSPQGTPIDNRVQVAKQAADKITQINGVKSANVLVTKSNAYVAAVVNTNQGQLTSDLEHRIAQQVRATDPSIQNVYVSTNPEFVNRVNKYVADIVQGRPVSGFVEEFTVMVNRIFPSAR